MDETTQQNAALVEEATAAARAMEEQAQQLGTAVAIFRLQAHPGTAAAPARRSAPARGASRLPVAAVAGEEWQTF